MNYEIDLEIDRDSLDQEWLKQPQLYFRYAKLASDADAEMGKIKERLETTKAEQDGYIREKAKEDGEKITEKIVESRIIAGKAYKYIFDQFNVAKHEVGIMRAAVMAMEQRKSALENLVKLYCAGYWAEPREPKDSKFEEKAIDKAEVKQRKTLNNKRRK